jgi:hypothetical protein
MKEKETRRPFAFARRGARALAAVMPKVTARAFARRGFTEAGIIADWPAIVGAALAASCRPQKLAFERGKRSDGTLHLRVAGALATEVQHLAPQIVERVNGYFGYRAVARLKIVQGPLPPPEGAREPATRPLGADEAEALRAMVADVPGEGLRTALVGLGRAVMGRMPRRTGGR